jgi:hypothetical protein
MGLLNMWVKKENFASLVFENGNILVLDGFSNQMFGIH